MSKHLLSPSTKILQRHPACTPKFRFSRSKSAIVKILIIFSIFILPLSTACSGSEATALPLTQTSETDQTGAVEGGAEEGERVTVFITAAIGLLLIAALVGIVTNRLRLPYTVGLVLIGLALSLRGQEQINISPDIFLGLLVPPLIFEAAFHIKFNDLRRDLAPILVLAIPGVLITTFLVGGVVALGTGFPIAVALVFGALVAATDPVAVVSLFRSLGVPKRLQVLLEGESLFNDGTAIVIFNLMVVIAVSGSFDLIDSLFDFILVAGGGLVVGFILGVLISRIISFIDDPLIETTLTMVLAFGSYLVAEQFHVSGVLAVVVAGLVSGNLGPRAMAPSTHILVFNFWDIAAYFANSVVFLLIGLQINLRVLVSDWHVIVWAIVAVLVARAVGVYGLLGVRSGVPLRYKNVLYWGGLRGAISLALAISLPASLGTAREDIQAMAFGVVLFTLLVQGLTMKPLINKMGLIQRSEAQEEYERRHARAVMANSSYERLETMHKDGLLSSHLRERLSGPLKKHAEALSGAAEEALQADPSLEMQELDSAFRDILQTQRSALTALLRDGIISEETFTLLVGEVDTALTDRRANLIELLRVDTSQSIDGLLAVIVQEADVENIVASLNRLALPVTRLSSTGSFLGHRNVTLLVGTLKGQEDAIKKAISRASRQRVEFLPTPAQGPDMGASVMVGGATLFAFDVERYEVL